MTAAAEHWEKDKLGRRDDAEFLIKFLLNRVDERGEMGRPKSYVLNIDAQWGDGKTFFLKGLEAQLSEDGYPVAYVNAWADDHAEDPMIAVVSAIDGAISPLLSSNKKLRTDWGKVRKSASNIARSVGKGLAKQGAKLLIGASVELVEQEIAEIKDEVSDATETLASATGDAIDGFFEERDEIRTFRETLTSILVALSGRKSQKLPLFVLIDELDRCRPPYAIAMLERVKHLFDIDDVVFVIATDSEQLQHAIRSVYGSEFASERYLSRFFDRSFRFAEPSPSEFVAKLFSEYRFPEELLSSPPGKNHEEFFSDVASEFSLGLRDIEQAFDLFRSVVTAWESKAQIELIVLLPLIALWQKKVEGMYSAFSDIRFREFLSGNFSSAPKCLTFYSTGGDGCAQVEKKAIWEVLAETISVCERPIREIALGGTSSGGASRWIEDIVDREFGTLHQNSNGQNAQSYSILRGYPHIIRNLGRIAPQDGDPSVG